MNAQRVDAAFGQACRTTLYQCSKSDSVQQRLAETVLQELPRLTAKQNEKYCCAIQKSDAVLGPFAVAWLLGACFRQRPPPQVRCAIDALQKDGRQMRKLRKCNEAWGMDIYDVVHFREPRQLPRYYSEPLLAKR